MISIMFSFKKNRKIKIVKRSFACEMQKKKKASWSILFLFSIEFCNSSSNCRRTVYPSCERWNVLKKIVFQRKTLRDMRSICKTSRHQSSRNPFNKGERSASQHFWKLGVHPFETFHHPPVQISWKWRPATCRTFQWHVALNSAETESC